MLRWIRRLTDDFLMLLGGLSLLGIMLGVVADVIGRNFFDSPVRLMHQLTVNVFMPTITFFSLASLALVGGHVASEFLIRRLPFGVQLAAARVFVAIEALFWGLISLTAILETAHWFRVGAPPSIASRIHPALSYGIIGVGAAIAALIYLVLLFSSKAGPVAAVQDRTAGKPQKSFD